MSLAFKLKAFLDDRVSYYETKRSYVTNCVSCGKADHFYIRKDNGRSICFKCGVKFNWRGLVGSIAKVPANKAYELIFGVGGGDIIDLPLDPELFSRVYKDDEEPEDATVFLGPDFFPVEYSDQGVQYLIKRGLNNPSLILHYDIRYHHAMNAVVFPVRRNGHVYGWQARKINPAEGELRLISSSNFNKSRFLLNWDRAVKTDRIVLVEGPFDCVHVDVDGYGAVASLGKGVSLDQIQLILSAPAKNIYLGLDPDASREFYEIVNRLGLSKNCFLISPPAHRKDFGEATEGEVRTALRSAIPVSAKADVLSVYFK
jgi:hypothetical protein